MQRRLGLPPTIVAVLSTVGLVVVVSLFQGAAMFNPGPLHANRRTRIESGGVMSHAELAKNCSACHAAPWSSDTMADRCLECHTDVRHELENRQPLHGMMSDGMQCRTCHTEHQGAHAEITDRAKFHHDFTSFPLTGEHVGLTCQACHRDGVFKGTANECESCHAEPAVHLGKFGNRCGDCHSTSTWARAVFQHSFPLNHGVGKRNTSTCNTCHKAQDDYLTYTCYGCHKHDPEKEQRRHAKKRLHDIDKCAKCHPKGRE